MTVNRPALFQSLLTTVFVLVALFIYSKFIGPVMNDTAPKRTFEVQGTGTVKITPKTVQTDISIQEKGTTREEVQKTGNTKQAEVMKMLESLGFKKADITTSGYSINPNYDYGTVIVPDRQPKENGFIMYVNITAKTDDIEKMNKAIDQIPSLGVNVGGINYMSNNEDTAEYKNQARKKAVEDARKKAEGLAESAGFKLGKIASIREGESYGGYPVPMMEKLDRSTTSQAVPPTDLQPGTNEISSSVTMTYYIND